MILKRKLYTNAEGKNTKKARKKTDLGDIAISSGLGALSGYGFARTLGAPTKPAMAISAGLAGGGELLKTINRKRNTKKGKPHKPEELDIQQPGKVGKALGISTAALAGAILPQKSSESRAVELINEVIEGKSKRMKNADPEKLQKVREWVAMNRAAFGKELGDKRIIEQISKSDIGKEYTRSKNIKSAIIGAATLGTGAALSIHHNNKKRKLLKEAYEKDRAEFEQKKKEE